MSTSKDNDDARLIAAVRRAAAAQLPADKVEGRVRRRAALRHWRDASGQRIHGVDIAPDRESGQISIPLADAREVVYWLRPLKDPHGNPRVAGVLWDSQGHAQAFFGVVLSPD